LIHFSVSYYYWFSHYLFWIASMPGNTLPSKNFIEAPPPVDMCVNLSANPIEITAAAESPPPIIVVAFSNDASVSAIPNVPAL
jgi:hypothetical protein